MSAAEWVFTCQIIAFGALAIAVGLDSLRKQP